MRWTKAEFKEYLEETLIPDLQASGMNSTAADFAAASHFLEDAEEVETNEDGTATRID